MKSALISVALLAVLLGTGCASRAPSTDAGEADATPKPLAERPIPPSVQAPAGMSDSDFEAWAAQHHSRLAEERQTANQRFQTTELACWRRFAVNDCVRAARAERRAALEQLRQQELGLNQQERQRRTAERLRQLDEKQKDVR